MFNLFRRDPANDQATQQMLETTISSRARNKNCLENIAGLMICSAAFTLLDQTYVTYYLKEVFNPKEIFGYYIAPGAGGYHTSWGHNGSSVIGFLVSIYPQVYDVGLQAVEKGLDFQQINWESNWNQVLSKMMLYGAAAICAKVATDQYILTKTKGILQSIGRGMSNLLRRY